MNKLKTNAAALAVFVGAVYGWADFLWKPLYTSELSLAFKLAELVKPISPLYEFPFGGWLFIIASTAISIWILVVILQVARWILTYIDDSRAAISILETNMRLDFDDSSMQRATLSRDQLLHANRAVTAYRATASVSAEKATIEPNSFRSFVEVDGRDIIEKTMQFGSPRECETIEMFSRPLPLSILATYLPNGLVHFLRDQFLDVIVNRKTSLVHLNEYCVEKPFIKLSAPPRPINNFKLEINFFSETAPDKDDIEAFLVSENTARPVTPIIDPNAPIGITRYTFKCRRVSNVSLLVTWRNTKIFPNRIDDRRRKSSGAKRSWLGRLFNGNL